MNERCRCPTHQSWARYGGRGIEVCDRWRDFLSFIADMGQPPPGLTLEREDNSGNYEPGNCKWVTRKAQQNNLRSNVIVTFQGRTQTLTQWSNEIGFSYSAVHQRMRHGKSFEQAIGVAA